MLNVMQMDYPS